MRNISIYFISVLIIMLSASLTVAIVQENGSMKEIINMTSNNSTSDNITPDNTILNNMAINITAPNNNDVTNNTVANASINLSTAHPEQANETFFIIGNGYKGNKSTYKVDIPTLPAKNASNLWYIIQSKPHGYV